MSTYLREHPGFSCPRTLENRNRFGVDLFGGINETLFEIFDILNKFIWSGSDKSGFVRLSKLCRR
jgi:hypothetical protein